MVTSTTPRTGRRAVRRRARPTIDPTWSTVLAEVDASLRPAIVAYVETSQAAYRARMELTSAMIGTKWRWRSIDALVRPFLSAA